MGDRGQERAPGAPRGRSLPSPAALLSFCTSAGNVPLTYIFFQTYVTFFFFFSLCGRRQARIQEKEKLERRARGNREAFTEHRHVHINSPRSQELLFHSLLGSETESGGKGRPRAPPRPGSVTSFP